MQEDITLFSDRAVRRGCKDCAGFDGGRALRFVNADLSRAADCVSFPGALPDTGSFTLRLWLRAKMGACHSYCRGEEFLPVAERTDPAQYTEIQRQYASTLLANTTFHDLLTPGLLIAHLQPRAYLTVHLLPRGAQEALQFTGIRDTYDGRWHMLTLAVDRAGEAALYIDDKKRASADIARWQGLPLGSRDLILGADALGQNGFGVGEICGFHLEDHAADAAETARRYWADAARMLLYEIEQRHWEDSPLFEKETALAFLQRAHDIAREGGEAAFRALKKEYDAFMLRTVAPDLRLAVVSDLHCDGDEGGRTAAFRKGLRWANELGMEALLDGGDYSNFGKDFELDSYWNSIRAGWRGKPLFVSVGNHETLERKCYELVRYHCDRLREQGMAGPQQDKFFYDGEYKGYHFIVLAQYSDTYTVTGYKRMWRYAAGIKPEQIAFAREKLDAYCGQGKPVFLLIHNAVPSLLDKQTMGHFSDDSALLGGEELLKVLENHPDAVLCTGHVHHGLGGGAGLYHLTPENFNVLDITGFRGGVIGYCAGERETPGIRHGAYFLYVFGKTLLLRAVDFATGEWLTAYDQVFTLPI